MIGGLLRVLIIALVLLVAALMLFPRPAELPGNGGPATEAATVLPERRELPDVALVDHNGEPFRLAQLGGRPAFVFFGFTNCPDICPLTLAVIARAVDELRAVDGAAAPQVLFVSVDPARDTPERIAAYVTAFDERFIGVTAEEAGLAPLLEALSVTVHKQEVDGERYNVVHNGTVYVLDSAGRWAALFGGSSHRAETLVNDYRALEPTL